MILPLALALLSHSVYHLTTFRQLKSQFEEPFYTPIDVR
jgi:hypothetical protein